MRWKAKAVSHGAVTIINAIAMGKGATLGIDLWTKAEVELTEEKGEIKGEIVTDPNESTILIEKAVLRVLKYFNLQDRFGARVKTWSNIPIARGLKSSSVAANAIVLATVAALGKSLDDLSIVNLGVDAAIDAGVTITGAFDDACGSYFGGIIVTDNMRRKIVKKFRVNEDVRVVLYVPRRKSYTGKSDVKRMRGVASLVEVAYEEAVKGNYWTALTLNGLIYSSALGYNPSIAIEALMNGAIAAGLSGTGPSFAAIVPTDKVDEVRETWKKYEGDILLAHINNEKARVVN